MTKSQAIDMVVDYLEDVIERLDMEPHFAAIQDTKPGMMWPEDAVEKCCGFADKYIQGYYVHPDNVIVPESQSDDKLFPAVDGVNGRTLYCDVSPEFTFVSTSEYVGRVIPYEVQAATQ